MAPSAELLSRHRGRYLTPATAERFVGEDLDPTVYAGNRLLIRPTSGLSTVIATLERVASEQGWELEVDEADLQMMRLARKAGIDPDEPQPLLIRAKLLSRHPQPISPPDVWPVLQAFRAQFGPRDPLRKSVQLDHLITSAVDDVEIGGNPYIRLPGVGGNPYIRLPGLSEYGEPGFGGRTPVTWVGADPQRTPDDQLLGRRPVVAILDTGIAEHPWLSGDIVERDPKCGTLPIGLPGKATDTPAPDDLTGFMEEHTGHGTFIAGLIRQKCPDARVLSVRIMKNDGVVAEGDLLRALNLLWLRQKLAILDNRPDKLIDVVSLSLGYYHEDPDGAAFDSFLLAPLRALGALGVAVIASGGNDATSKPMFPAAFAPHSAGLVKKTERQVVPIVSVGACNPNGTTALFSNNGPWIRVHRPGASLISTMPRLDASRSPSAALRLGSQQRETIDPDAFDSGFGLWSGTSFSAPILAGEIAEWLHRRTLPADSVDPAAALDRGWAALEHFVPRMRRPR